MPTVPRISETRVKQSAAPNVRVTTDITAESVGGGQTALNVKNAGAALNDEIKSIIAKEQQRSDDTAVLEANSEMARFEIELSKQRSQLKGKNSFNIPEDEREARAVAYQDIFDKTPNDRVLDRVRPLAQQSSISGERQASIYVNNERERHIEETLNASIENNINLALNTGSQEEMQFSIAKNEKSIEDFGRNTEGKDDITIKNEVDAMKTKAHTAFINQLIAVDTNAAEEYYELNKDEINNSVLNRSDLDKMITARHKSNVKAIEDDLNDKLIDETLKPEDVLSVSQPIEQGGIGGKKARSILNILKRNQDGRINEILISGIEEKEKEIANNYLDMVDKFVAKDRDSFSFKQLVIESFGDGFLNKSEKSDLNALTKRFTELEKENQNPNWLFNAINEWIQFNTSGQRVVDKISDVFGEKEESVSTATSLKSLIHRIGKGEDPQEAVQAVNRADHVARNPQRADYEVGKSYTEQNIKFKFNGFLDLDDMDVELVK